MLFLRQESQIQIKVWISKVNTMPLATNIHNKHKDMFHWEWSTMMMNPANLIQPTLAFIFWIKFQAKYLYAFVWAKVRRLNSIHWLFIATEVLGWIILLFILMELDPFIRILRNILYEKWNFINETIFFFSF